MKAALAAAIAAVAVASAQAAGVSVWRPVATGVNTDTYYTYATVNADIGKARAIAVQATGARGAPKVTWYLTCEGAYTAATPHVLSVGAAQKCSVNASGTGMSGGTVRVVILKR